MLYVVGTFVRIVARMNPPARVIMTTFAGRRDRMAILLTYVVEALRRNLLREYHIWNYARNRRDRSWVDSLHVLHPGIRIFRPVGTPYDSYYDHYRREDYSDAIFVKVDDDIVYLDLETFPKFIEHRLLDRETFLLSANVVNNGVCAYFQQQENLLPPDFPELGYPERGFCGTLWESPLLAARLHEAVLAAPGSPGYPGTRIAPDRLSINFISYLGRDLDYILGTRGDDEEALSVRIPRELRRVNRIYNPFVVSHLSFYSQEAEMDTARLLKSYRRLAAALGGRRGDILRRVRQFLWWRTLGVLRIFRLRA